jgi:glutamate-ammonia-ligase adenylyltransferase
MRVSDRLTEIAEVLLEKALCLAAWHLSPQLGQPMCGIGRRRRPVRIAAVGYGKLGGQELGYSSDLDLVFLHDSTGDAQHTSGVKPVDNQIYFVRFVQRLVHALSFHSAAGRLYDIDMRLRPSGKGGLLITSVDAFAEYQRSEAWTWEHQALLHARAVAGDESVRARFDAVRTELVCRSRVAASLRSEVAEMRQRRVEQLSEAGEGECDLKHDAGGIGDIEFLAQYWVLRWAHAQPPLGMFADTIRQLESVASANLRPQREIDVLTGAYRHFRALLHRRSLDGLGSVVPAAEVAKQRAAVAALWAAEMELAPLR